MRPEDILDAMGELDDGILLAAKEKPKSKKAFIYSAAAVAACLIILSGTVFNPVFRLATSEKGESAADNAPEAEEEKYNGSASHDPSAEGTVSLDTNDKYHSSLSGSTAEYPIPESSAEEKAFAIFYVSNGVTEKEESTLISSPQAVFNKWKEKHGINAEIELIDFSAEIKPLTETYYFEGECIVEHTSDGIICLNITVSHALSDYYDIFGEEELISSLTKTMIGYTGKNFDECNVILK